MDTNPNWSLNAGYAARNQFEKFNKSHPREYQSLFANLDKILTLLKQGRKIGGFHVGFFRSESDGLFRIGQTGVSHALESRLYIYPDSETRILYILGIGDKSEQQGDINAAKKQIETIRKAQPRKAQPPPPEISKNQL